MTEKNESSGNFPLHIACAMQRPVQGLIAFLATKFPQATSRKNRDGDLPLHLLLRAQTGRTINNDDRPQHQSSFSVVQVLDDIKHLIDFYPASVVVTCQDRKTTALDMVLESSILDQQVMTFLCSHAPKKVRFFQLRSSSINGTLCHATALSNLSYQLTVLECKRKDWILEGWIHLLSSLQTNTSIRVLSLMLPHSITIHQYMHALQNFVSNNTGVKNLSLFHLYSTTMLSLPCPTTTTTTTTTATTIAPPTTTDDEWDDFTPVMKNLLEHNRTIGSLTLVGVHFDMQALTQTLAHNTTLVEWNLEYCPTLQFDQLAYILQHHNTSLQKLRVPCNYYRDTNHNSDHDVTTMIACPIMLKQTILYWGTFESIWTTEISHAIDPASRYLVFLGDTERARICSTAGNAH